MKYKAKLLKANVPTCNGRIYTKECLESANKYIQENLKEGGLLSEFSENVDEFEIYTKALSHKITDSYIENDTLNVELEILNTPMGINVQNALNEGLNLYACTRGVGMLNDDNIVSDYELLSVDLYDKPPYDDSEPLKIVGEKK